MTEAREDDEQYRYPMEGIARFDTFPTESFRYHLQYDGDRGRIRLSSKKTNVHWDCSIVNIKDFGNDEVVTTTAQTLDELAINLAHLFSGGGAKWDVYKVTLEPSKSSDDGDDKDVGYSESDCNDDNSHDDHGGELTLRLLRTDGYSTASDAVWGCLYAFPLRVAGVAETVEKVKADLKTSQRRCRRKTTENEQLRKGLEASKATVSALKAEIDEHKAATISAQKKTTRARAELKRVKDAAAIATKAPADAAFRRAADGSTVSTTLPPKTPATTSTPTPSASSELESLRAKLQVHECAISELSGRMTRQKLKFYLMPQSYSSTKQQGKKSTKRQATQQSQQNSAQPVHTNHDQQQQHRTEPPHQPKRQKIDDDDVKPEWVDV